MIRLLRRFWLCLGGLAFGVATITGAAAAPARYALLIGVNNYPNLPQHKQLSTPVSDANSLGKVLGPLGFSVKILTNPGLADMGAQVKIVADQLRPGDTVLFFFAGHGLSPDNTNLLLPSDFQVDFRHPAAKDLARRRSYAESEIILAFQAKLKDPRTGQPTGLIVVISDACRDNPFIDAEPSLTRSLGMPDQGAVPRPTAGVFSIYAAGMGQQSLDRLSPNDTTQNSVFMRVFLQKIAAPGKSLSEVTVETRQVVKQLAEMVQKGGLPHRQTVAYYDETFGGPIIFANTSPTPPEPPTNSSTTQIAFKNFNNRDIQGGDYRTLKGVDMPACAAACRSDAQCRGLSYDKWNRWCFLKSRLYTMVLEPSSITAIRDDMPTPNTSTTQPEMQRKVGKIFPGDGYRTVDAKSSNACIPICENDLSCVAFSFLKREERCKLFKTANEYFSDDNADIGIKRQTAP